MPGELQGFSEHGSSGYHRQAKFPAPWDRGSQPAKGHHLVPALRILGEGTCPASQGPEDMTPSAAAIPGPQKQPRIYRFAPIQLLSLLWHMPCACRARASETWRPCPEHQAAMRSEHLPPSTQSWRFCKCSNPTTASWRTKEEEWDTALPRDSRDLNFCSDRPELINNPGQVLPLIKKGEGESPLLLSKTRAVNQKTSSND